ncbi:MAG: NUDIX hydrolase [Balneolales bacterium]
MKLKVWTVTSKKMEYETPVYNVYRNEAQSQDTGIRGDFFVIDAPDWTNVLAVTPQDEVILVRQYRHGIEKLTLEIPGGVIDPSDDRPLDAAKRELSEETGYTSSKWTRLGKVSANPAIMNNWCHLFLAEDCRLTDPLNPDAHEELTVHRRPRKAFLKDVEDGGIHHSLVVAAVAKLGLIKPQWLKKS